MELGIALSLFCNEIQEVPLGHERNELAMRWQMRKIGNTHLEIFDQGSNCRQLLMWALQEAVEDAKLVHQFERRGMNRVAAKIAKKVRMLFEHLDLYSGAGEKKAEHHAGRSSAHDAATSPHGLGMGIGGMHGRVPVSIVA